MPKAHLLVGGGIMHHYILYCYVNYEVQSTIALFYMSSSTSIWTCIIAVQMVIAGSHLSWLSRERVAHDQADTVATVVSWFMSHKINMFFLG